MAKTVFSSPKEICHLWANQSQNEARTSKRTLSFFENEIYSYGKKIAQIFPAHNIVMVTTRVYSITTSRHQRYLWDALPNHYRVIEVYDSFRPENIISWLNEHLETQISKLKNARKPAKYLVEIEKQRRNAEVYLSNFREIYTGDYTQEGMEYFYKKIFELIEAHARFVGTADSKALAKAYIQDKEAKEKEKREQIREEYEARIKAWKNHERDNEGRLITVPQSQIQIMCGETDFARLSKDGKEFESHRGARISKEQGLALFRIVTAFLKKGKEVELPIPIGLYTLEKVDKDGDCVVGCHRFTYAELKSVYETVADKQENETLTIN
jgi:hypothetical protein